jgi:hypothetical protein
MYWLYKFGTYELPRAGTNPENFPVTFKNPELDLFHGSVDLFGSDRTGLNTTVLSTNGVIDTLVGLKTLRRLIGTKADLYREDDDGNLDYVSARLVNVTTERVSKLCSTVTVDLEFHVYRPIWYAETGNTENQTISSATTNFSLDNTEAEIGIGGKITITVNAGATLTDPRITVGTQWVQYTGSLTAGDVLVFDNDGKTVTVNGSDAYADFSAANKSTWIELTPGASNSVSVTCTISGGTSSLVWEWETALL